MASIPKILDFSLTQDKIKRQEDAKGIILRINEEILTLELSYFGLKLSDFEQYRHCIVNFIKNSCCLSSNDRKLQFTR